MAKSVCPVQQSSTASQAPGQSSERWDRRPTVRAKPRHAARTIGPGATVGVTSRHATPTLGPWSDCRNGDRPGRPPPRPRSRSELIAAGASATHQQPSRPVRHTMRDTPGSSVRSQSSQNEMATPSAETVRYVEDPGLEPRPGHGRVGDDDPGDEHESEVVGLRPARLGDRFTSSATVRHAPRQEAKFPCRMPLGSVPGPPHLSMWWGRTTSGRRGAGAGSVHRPGRLPWPPPLGSSPRRAGCGPARPVRRFGSGVA